MELFNMLVIVAVTFLIFLICREIVLWYWRINHIVVALEKILAELQKMNEPKI